MENINVYNNKRLIIDFTKNLIKIIRLTLDSILLGKKNIEIWLILKDKIEKLMLSPIKVFYFSNSSLNFIRLGYLNNICIYYYNKD